jgi:hypothetical protein
LLLALAACLGSRRGAPRGDLAGGDPDGARACRILDDWLRGGRTTKERDVSDAAGRYASIAKTSTIRASVAGVADVPRSGSTSGYDFDGYWVVDLHELHAACRAAGVDLPAYPG